MTVRLYLDSSNVLWALVRCDVCLDVNKYQATAAAHSPIECKRCRRSMDVREQIRTNAAYLPEISGEMLTTLSAVKRSRSSEVLDR